MAPTRRFPTILIVDDHDDSREALAHLVGSLGYHAFLARDGEEALRWLRTLRPDLVLCNLRMPEMDGFAFMAALRADPKLADLIVVAVTAHGDPAHLKRTFEAGFADHVTKPIDYDGMVATLERLLGPRRRG